MDSKDIEIRVIEISDLHLEALRKFNRYQVTSSVRYKENDKYIYKDEHFIESWDEVKKHQVIQSLKQCVCNGGIAAGAFKNNELIGFANVENGSFGKNKDYLELSYIHVSNELRNLGIGKKLFHLCSEEAKAIGAKKLYIAAHPAVETQHFYRSLGCVLAEETNNEIYEREPLDIQLEFIL